MSFHERVRALAARVFGPKTMERVIDPALADVQTEHRTAIAQGHLWRSRWIRTAGYFAVLKAIALHGFDRTVRDWSVDERRAFARTLGLSAAAFAAATLLLISPVVQSVPTNQVLYLLPQALPLAIPVGITLGVFGALGGRVVPIRLKEAVLALALACSAGSLATTAWMIPVANQSFRVFVSEQVRQIQGGKATLSKGPLEMPLGELRRKIDTSMHAGPTRETRNMEAVYYMRWAVPFAPFVLALFALSAMPRRPVRRWTLAATACGACLSYYLLLLAADLAARQTAMPIVASAWLPNFVFVLSTALMIAARTPSPSSHA